MTSTVALIAISAVITAINLVLVRSARQSIRMREEARTKELREMGVERRVIWFWQEARYLDQGWSTSWTRAGWSPFSWIEYLETRTRIVATRRTPGTQAASIPKPIPQQETVQ